MKIIVGNELSIIVIYSIKIEIYLVSFPLNFREYLNPNSSDALVEIALLPALFLCILVRGFDISLEKENPERYKEKLRNAEVVADRTRPLSDPVS